MTSKQILIEHMKVLGKTANGKGAHKCKNKYLVYINESIV